MIHAENIAHIQQQVNRSAPTGLATETHSYELEFVKTYEQLPILWDLNHPEYTNKYKRGLATDELVRVLKKWDSNATRHSVRQKVNILRSTYRKDLRKHLASKSIGADGEEIYEYTPKSWKFWALAFLAPQMEDVLPTKNCSIEEINLDNTHLELEGNEESETENNFSLANDVLRSLNEEQENQSIQNQSLNHIQHTQINNDATVKKRIKIDIQDYFVDKVLDKELDAIGSNVACKLKRMNPDQRNHAELLINKVLIEGLKNHLTDYTDLT